VCFIKSKLPADVYQWAFAFLDKECRFAEPGDKGEKKIASLRSQGKKSDSASQN
jgi:hypothetical protein